MLRWQIGLIGLTLVLTGCSPQSGLTLTDVLSLLGSDTGLGHPDLPQGGVRVQLVNASGHEADVRVTMRVAGEQVHFSFQRLAINAADLVIGPDRADSVLVEITLLGNPNQALQPLTYFLGLGFHSGDTILVRILPPADGGDSGHHPPSDGDQEPGQDGSGGQTTPPLPVAVTIEGLKTDVRVSPGMEVGFDVVVAGDARSAARINVYADRDRTPASGDEITIATDLAAAGRIPIRWTVPDLPPARYFIYAEVRDGAAVVRSAFAPGAVRVNAPPQLSFDSPRPNQAVTLGRPLVIAWAGVDADDDAQIAIFLDTDNHYAGDQTERILRSGISAREVQDRQYTLDTWTLAPGVYYVGGVIDDGLSTAVAYAGPVLITRRLVGRFRPSDFAPGEMVTISGATSGLFGAAIDASRSLNAATDALADIVVGDPAALIDTGEANVPGGAAYYFQSPGGNWPRNLTASDATLRFIGEGAAADTGRRVALLGPLGGDAPADGALLIGAPRFVTQGTGPDGRAYLLRGPALLPLIGQQPDIALGALQAGLGATLWADAGAAVGLDVAALGDVDGSGTPDFAIGAVGARSAAVGYVGAAYVFSGDNPPVGGAVQYQAGAQLLGVSPDELAGYAIRSVRDANADNIDELAIGAPGGYRQADRTAADRRAGVVYLVFGHESLLVGDGQSYSLAELGQSLAGRIFVGENEGDLAGAAIASGDFDGDGQPDLLIGAPGYAKGRGRVYLVYDVGGSGLPDAPARIDLGLVGSTYAGAILDGLAAGDQLGFAVASAGDFDGLCVDDRHIDDLLLGAPGAESARGVAYLLYGNAAPPLTGRVDLANIGTTTLPGWELVGEEGLVSRLGEALSAGDVNGDGLSDVAIGAPGDLGNPGAAHVLFGRPAPLAR